MEDYEKLAASHDVEVRHKLIIIDKSTKKEVYINRYLNDQEVDNILNKESLKNCSVYGLPNIRVANSSNQMKVFRE